ncbi:discoidin domain-containing protein [Butyrivibrio sp. AE3004]|uniref:discoidin domain-containing protein n=1 Tax=Butyrivibrio sp. AE3004 TaxID=1506994 RepID=UPI0004942E74|nr:discoidin domain-containing protein [Butyrivibrio sp. AE3004]
MGKNLRSYMVMYIMTALVLNVTACGKGQTVVAGNVEKTQIEEKTENSFDNSEVTNEQSEFEQEDASNQTEFGQEDTIEQTDVEEIKTQTETPSEETEVGYLTEAECIDEIEKLRNTEPFIPDNKDTLSEMADCVTVSRILDEQGMIFSKMENSRKEFLRYQILCQIMWGQNLSEDIAETIDGETAISLDNAKRVFRDVYGEENFIPGEYEKADDEYLYPMFGDGEPWENVEHKQFFEDEKYILLSGPAFYESNGGDEEFLGYADILFAKNDASRYGVTLLYGKYRNDRIKVSSVETSSELEGTGGKNYSGKNLIDGDYKTIWAEGVSGTGVGENVILHLDKKQQVYGVLICNGYTASYEQYNNNGLLTDITADFGDGNTVSGTLSGYAYEGFSAENLADINKTKFELEEPVITDTIVITITGAKAGVKYDDTCVSEILVY